MRVKAPSDVVEYIRSKFQLVDRKVIKNDGSIPSFTIINKRNYSMSYVKDVLEGKDPDLSVLFDTIEGELYRNQDPVWAMYKGKKVSDKGSKICGVLITRDSIREIPNNQETTVTPQATPTLEPLVAPEYVINYIKDKFCIKGNAVFYTQGLKPFGAYASIDGMHYSKGYVQQVLEGKNPDISDLFESINGVICRSQDPIWGSFKGKPINTAKVCGISVNKEGFQVLEVAPREPLPTPDDYYKAIEVPEHIKLLIKYKFKIKDGKVFYNYYDKEFTSYSVLAGHRYSVSYVLAVLKGEKPNLETLFNIEDGCRIRNDDPVWDTYKGKKSKVEYKTCGELVPVKITAPSIPRPNDFAWLADLVQKGKLYSYKGKTQKAYIINGVLYSTGFIRETLSGKVFTQKDRPPIPAYLYKQVIIPGNSSVIMTSDDGDFWPNNSRLVEILENREYLINGFIYTGEEIIRQVSRDKTCIWDLDTFIDIASDTYPEASIVANIPLNDREETGEM